MTEVDLAVSLAEKIVRSQLPDDFNGVLKSIKIGDLRKADAAIAALDKSRGE